MGENGNWSPDVYAKWKKGTPCVCGTEHFVSRKIRWIEVPMMSDGDKFDMNMLRVVQGITSFGFSELVAAAVVGGFHDLTHECVEVIYKCKKCESEFRRTYEIVRLETHKSNEWGCYQKEFGATDVSETPRSFDFIESKYSTMWSNYSVVGGNHCKRWTKEFYSKIC